MPPKLDNSTVANHLRSISAFMRSLHRDFAPYCDMADGNAMMAGSIRQLESSEWGIPEAINNCQTLLAFANHMFTKDVVKNISGWREANEALGALKKADLVNASLIRDIATSNPNKQLLRTIVQQLEQQRDRGGRG